MNHGEPAHEAHEDDVVAVKKSTLSREEDEATARVIGCAIAVHSALGPGFLESIDKRALALELSCPIVAGWHPPHCLMTPGARASAKPSVVKEDMRRPRPR